LEKLSQLHVEGKVKGEDITEGWIAAETNRCSSSGRIIGGWVYTNVDLIILVTYEIRIFSRSLGNVVNGSISWVGASVKWELVEEVGGIVLQNVSFPWFVVRNMPPVILRRDHELYIRLRQEYTKLLVRRESTGRSHKVWVIVRHAWFDNVHVKR
jgi:hypothetical protein